MTRKKIDLGLANRDWLATQSEHTQKLFAQQERDLAHWSEESRNGRMNKELLRLYVRSALNISIREIGFESDRVIIRTTYALDASDLNRLMNSEIHHEGRVLVFRALGPDSCEEGDIYMGEHTSYTVALLEIVYAPK